MASKPELFLKLAQPDDNGYSRWVHINEFVGEFSPLVFGNGADWARKESTRPMTQESRSPMYTPSASRSPSGRATGVRERAACSSVTVSRNLTNFSFF